MQFVALRATSAVTTLSRRSSHCELPATRDAQCRRVALPLHLQRRSRYHGRSLRPGRAVGRASRASPRKGIPRDIKVDGREAPIRAATVRERMPATESANAPSRSRLCLAVWCTPGFLRLAGIWANRLTFMSLVLFAKRGLPGEIAGGFHDHAKLHGGRIELAIEGRPGFRRRLPARAANWWRCAAGIRPDETCRRAKDRDRKAAGQSVSAAWFLTNFRVTAVKPR
jgi:hypothetical protein